MKSILRIVVLLSMLLLVTSGLAQAQEPVDTFCGDLSAADCTLMTESQVVMQGLESSSFKLDMTVDLTGIPDMPADKMSFKLTGSGSTTVDQKALPDMSKLDPTTLTKDPMAIFKMIGDAIQYVSADLSFALDIPAELTKNMGDVKLPNPIKLNVKLVDGVAYVNVGDFADITPQFKGAKGWMGMSLPDLIEAILKQPEFSASMSGMSSSMSSSMGMSSNMMELFSDPDTLASFIKLERLADSEVDSQKVAVFQTTLDYAAMFAAPWMKDVMEQQTAAMGSKLTEKDLKATMDMLQELAKGMKFSSTQSVDLENKYVYETTMSMTFDMSSMKAMMGAAPVFTLNATITQGDFNSVSAITAPEGALVLPVESFMPSKSSK